MRNRVRCINFTLLFDGAQKICPRGSHQILCVHLRISVVLKISLTVLTRKLLHFYFSVLYLSCVSHTCFVALISEIVRKMK